MATKKTKAVLRLEAKRDELKAALKGATTDLKQFEKGLAESRKETKKAQAAQKEYVKDNRRLQQIVRKTAEEKRRAIFATKEYKKANDGLAMSLRNSLGGFVSITAAVYGVQRAFSAGLRNAISFDRTLVNIQKTTGITGVELDRLREKIIRVSSGEGVDRDTVGGIAGIGGTLGLGSEAELSVLLEIITQLERATDLTAETAAASLTKIINLTGGDIVRDLRSVADAMVNLGNNTNTTERSIAELGVQLAAILGRFGVDAVDVTGYAAALGVVEGQAAGASTAFNKFLTNLLLIAEKGGPKFETFAKALGRSTEQLGNDIQTNFSDVLVDTLRVLRELDPASANRFLTYLNLPDQRTQQNLQRVASFAPETIATARTGAEEGVALTEENAARLNEASGRLDIALTNIVNIFNAFGDDVLLALDVVLKAIQESTRKANKTFVDERTLRAQGIAAQAAGAVPFSGRPFYPDVAGGITARMDEHGNIPGTNLSPSFDRIQEILRLAELDRERAENAGLIDFYKGQFGDARKTVVPDPTMGQNINQMMDSLTGGAGRLFQVRENARAEQIGNEIRAILGNNPIASTGGLRYDPLSSIRAPGRRSFYPPVSEEETRRNTLANYSRDTENLIRFVAGNDPSANLNLIRQQRGVGRARLSAQTNPNLTDSERDLAMSRADTQEMLLRQQQDAANERLAAQKKANEQLEALDEERAMNQIEIAKRFGKGMTQEELAFQQRRAQLAEDAVRIDFMEDGPQKLAAQAVHEMNQTILDAEMKAAADRLAVANNEAAVEKELLLREARDLRTLTRLRYTNASEDFIEYTRQMQEISREYYRIMKTMNGEARDAALAALEDLRAQVEETSPAEQAKRDTAAKHKAEYDAFGNVMTESVADSIRNNRSVGDAMDHLMDQVAAHLLEQQIVKPFSEAISSILNEALTSIIGTQSRNPFGAGGGGVVSSIFSAFTGGVPIPGLAAGGDVRQGGLALVGEKGPELLSLDQGARVTPLQGGGMGGYNVTNNVYGVQDPTIVRQQIEAIEPQMYQRFKARLANEAPNTAFSRRVGRR